MFASWHVVLGMQVAVRVVGGLYGRANWRLQRSCRKVEGSSRRREKSALCRRMISRRCHGDEGKTIWELAWGNELGWAKKEA